MQNEVVTVAEEDLEIAFRIFAGKEFPYDHKCRLDSLISMGYAYHTCHTLS